MIAYVKGRVLSKEDTALVVDVGGLGYRVAVPDVVNHAHTIGSAVELHIHYHLRENTAELYGFSNQQELGLFTQLIGISGIGPKTALGILNACALDMLYRAVQLGDASLLKAVSGIGSKTAERIVIELKGKLHGGVLSQGPHVQSDSEIIDALVGLGYSQTDASKAVFGLDTAIESVEARLKAALKTLGKGMK